MKQLEIISFRTPGNFKKEDYHFLMSYCRKLKEPSLLEANLYINTSNIGDFAIILSWHTEQPNSQRTNIGMILANAMKQIGLVDHTSWLMIED